jgi:hypothetical protein
MTPSTPVPPAARLAPPADLFPQWWAPLHASSWDRVKEALHRDWEQTKAHFSATAGIELNQGLADTLKQAAGTDPIPSIARSNDEEPPAASWSSAEPAIRYGFAARMHFAKFQSWNDDVENLLRRDWESAWGSSWEHSRNDVHRGWDSAGQKA